MKKLIWISMTFLFMSCSGTPEKKDSAHYSISKKLKHLQAKPQQFKINPIQKNKIMGKRRTRLTIPENAFIDKDGNPIKQKVTIQLKEVIAPEDFILPETNLIYNMPNGQTALFESAGMFQITAQAGNKKLKLASGKKIMVQFPNKVPGDKFRIYKIKPDGNWVDVGHNQETTVKDEKTAKKADPVRKMFIDELTWYNFDYPRTDLAAIKGSIDKKLESFTLYMICEDFFGTYRFAFKNTQDFLITGLLKRSFKILITDQKGNAYKVKQRILIWGKAGNVKIKESSKNPYMDLGVLKLEKISKGKLKSKKALMQEAGVKIRPPSGLKTMLPKRTKLYRLFERVREAKKMAEKKISDFNTSSLLRKAREKRKKTFKRKSKKDSLKDTLKGME